jgi:hypothetical protein
MSEQNSPRPIVPREMSTLGLHMHSEGFFYYLHDLTQFLNLTSSSDPEALSYHKLGPEFIERLRDPSFQSPCPSECFSVELFLSLYLFRFPGLFPVTGRCCQNKDRGICSKQDVLLTCQKTLWNLLPNEGLSESETASYLQAQNPECVVSERLTALQGLRQLAHSSFLLEVRQGRVYSVAEHSIDVRKWQRDRAQKSRRQPRGLAAFD